MNLTSKQKDELHKAIAGYLKQANMNDVLTAFEKEASIQFKDDMLQKMERKWRSIIRLENKITELEEENRSIQDQMQSFGEEGVVNTEEKLPESERHKMDAHREPVTCCKFHPRFNILVTGSEDNTIIVWDADTGDYQKTLKGHTDNVTFVQFNKQGTLLASGSADTTVKLWDFGKEMDGTFQCVRTLAGHDHTVSAGVFLSSGELFYTASRDKTIKMWEVETGHEKKTLEGHRDWVKDLALNPQETHLASASYDQTCSVWDLNTGSSICQLFDHDHDVLSVDWTPNAAADTFIINHLLDEDDQKVARVQQKKRLEELEGKEDKGGMFLLSCSRDRTIRLWFVHEGVCVRTFRGHENWVRQVMFHPSGRYFISCSDDASIRVWDMKKNARQCVRLEHAHESFVQCIDYNKHSPMLASGGVKNLVKVWSCA